MSVTVVDNDIVQPRRFRSMHGTDARWNCDSDHAVHLNDYCPDMDEDSANCPHPSAHYERPEQ
jgi:hypothetical protein